MAWWICKFGPQVVTASARVAFLTSKVLFVDSASIVCDEVLYGHCLDNHSAHVNVKELFLRQVLGSQIHYVLIISALQVGYPYSFYSSSNSSINVGDFFP